MCGGSRFYDWSEFIELAKELSNSGYFNRVNEASKRSSISRAYYGVHWIARNSAVQEVNLQLTNKGRDHSLVIKHYLNNSDRNKRAIGLKLSQLLDYRKEADYGKYSINNINYIASRSLTLAEEAQASFR